jgi:hypothetical protein
MTFTYKLSLRSVPQRVMSTSAFKFLEVVLMQPWVLGVPLQGVLSPRWKRFVSIIILAVSGKVVTDFPPGDQLIQILFAGGPHVPPSFSRAVASQSQFFWPAIFHLHDFGKYLLSRNMAEVKVGRKIAGSVELRVIMVFVVVRQLVFQKGL